jgi:hypothetical protein
MVSDHHHPPHDRTVIRRIEFAPKLLSKSGHHATAVRRRIRRCLPLPSLPPPALGSARLSSALPVPLSPSAHHRQHNQTLRRARTCVVLAGLSFILILSLLYYVIHASASPIRLSPVQPHPTTPPAAQQKQGEPRARIQPLAVAAEPIRAVHH